jgi:nicotinate-nucleotide pyrophosphorylase (carboxylating)
MHRDPNELSLPELFEALVDGAELEALIVGAMREDVGRGVEAGDMTSQMFVGAEETGEAVFRARGAGRLAGAVLLEKIARVYDPQLVVSEVLADGAKLASGEAIAKVAGPLRSLLTAERVMLNFLTYLSGVASLTGQYVELVEGTGVEILDTRKTIPGLRGLSKYAVRCGGGRCHRIGLYDAVMVKDNHIAGVGLEGVGGLAERLKAGIERARACNPAPWFIEVEVDTLEQLEVVLGVDVDVVLLDNMGPDVLREAVAIRDRMKPGVKLEASGGITLETVRAKAEAGVDYISIGALTHSAPSLDIGLDIGR